jgi:serine/threonine protein kinase
MGESATTIAFDEDALPDGELLEVVLARERGLPALVRMAIGAGAALAELHDRGFLHRDVNPSTIRVDARSGRARLARSPFLAPMPGRDDTAEPPRTIVGSLPYIAPEQTGRMNRAVDARSDLYSLGVTLYQMFTGELPFAASDPRRRACASVRWRSISCSSAACRCMPTAR